MSVNSIGIIGLGLIGGSVAKSLKRYARVNQTSCHTINAYVRREAPKQYALENQVIDVACDSIEQLVAQSDLIILGVPVGDAMVSVFETLRELFDKGVMTSEKIVTDVGSVKKSILDVAEQTFGEVPSWFVAAHPVAGSDNSGVEAALDDLFVKHRTILTPIDSTDADALAEVKTMWEQCGADVVSMSPEEHDCVLAAASHVPHVLSYTFIQSLANLKHADSIFENVAGGFRDFTRIAASDPTVWRDICLTNTKAILGVIKEFQLELSSIELAISQGDSEALFRYFEESKARRDACRHIFEKD